MKTDPISIIVYIIIGIILYYCIGIIVKLLYLYLCIPPFSYFRKYTFGFNNPLMILPIIIWSILYSTFVLIAITSVFVIILVVLIIIYIIWIILKKIPIFGPIILETVPPFKQLEEAGIFQLITDIIDTIARWLPKSVVKMFGKLFFIIVKFTKDRIIDIAKAIKPELELKPSEIDNMLSSMENFANPQDTVNVFKQKTLQYIDERNLAETYKSLISITPEMSEYDRMNVIFQNEAKKMNIQLGNVSYNIKIETATLPE